MLVLQVRLNGELKATCGADDLDAIVTWLRAKRAADSGKFEFLIECSGSRSIDAATSETIKWVSARVQLGDEITLQFVEATSAHTPIDRLTYPAYDAASDT